MKKLSKLNKNNSNSTKKDKKEKEKKDNIKKNSSNNNKRKKLTKNFNSNKTRMIIFILILFIFISIFIFIKNFLYDMYDSGSNKYSEKFKKVEILNEDKNKNKNYNYIFLYNDKNFTLIQNEDESNSKNSFQLQDVKSGENYTIDFYIKSSGDNFKDSDYNIVLKNVTKLNKNDSIKFFKVEKNKEILKSKFENSINSIKPMYNVVNGDDLDTNNYYYIYNYKNVKGIENKNFNLSYLEYTNSNNVIYDSSINFTIKYSNNNSIGVNLKYDDNSKNINIKNLKKIINNINFTTTEEKEVKEK